MSEVSPGPDRLIQIMPETLANKIAAGEVVQRPASALKELVENALDAGADQITIVLKAAGSELIQVIDNGCGMSAEDAVQCFRRHATSKIRSIEDLERIQTLGFRGEALASISAVAQVELKTRRVQDDVGFRVRVEGGKIEGREPCATPAGTSIAVRNLFYNVPARRNFLKTPATEFRHLVETFQFLTLANPAVAFTLVHDDNEVYRLQPARSADPREALRRRVGDLFGKEYMEQLIPVEETTSYVSLSGFVGVPEYHRRSRGEQFLFVNRRFVKSRYLDHAVLSAYEDVLPEGAYPFYTLFLHLDPRHVDVNVHPTKAEVKFDDERGIYGFVKAVVRKALGSASLTPQVEQRSRPSPEPFRISVSGDDGAYPRPFTASETGPRSREAIPPGSGGSGSSDRGGVSYSGSGPRRSGGGWEDRLYGPPSENPPEERVLASAARPEQSDERDHPDGEPLLWQLHNRYVLTPIRSGLMVLDQTAAHERILYERALQSMRNGFGLSQQLLFPHTLEFSPGDFELLKELLPDLRALGFDIELFSGRSAVVRGVPADIRPGDERSILDEILQQYKSYQSELHLRGRDNLAKSIARRSAIQPGTRLSAKEMRTLVDQLFMCEMPYASPHGHPTIIKISIEELDKRFGR